MFLNPSHKELILQSYCVFFFIPKVLRASNVGEVGGGFNRGSQSTNSTLLLQVDMTAIVHKNNSLQYMLHHVTEASRPVLYT